MKRILIITLFISLSMFSCKNGNVTGEGWLSLAVKTIESTNEVKSANDAIFSITILDKNSDTVRHYDNFHDMPDKISLQNGFYKAVCESENIGNKAVFDTPSYRGVQEFEIRPRGNTSVEVEVKIADVKVTVSFTERFKEHIQSYKTILSSDLGGELVFDQEDTRVGYIKVEDALKYSLQFRDNLDELITYAKYKTGLQPADWLKLEFDLSEGPQEDITSAIRIFVDVTVNEVRHRFEMPLDGGIPPSVDAVNFDPDRVIRVEDDTETLSKLSIRSEKGVDGVYLKVNNNYFESISLPRWFNLMTLTPEQRTILTDQGLIFVEDITGVYPNIGTVGSLTLDFKEIAKRFPSGANIFELSVISTEFAEKKMNLTFDVIGNPIKMSPVESSDITESFNTALNGNKVRLSGYWTSTAVPEGLTFQYQVAGASDWIVVDPAMVTLEELSKSFSANVFVPQNSDIIAKAISYSNGTIVSEGAGQAAFRSREIPMIPNLSFEQWHQSGSGNTICYYPNTSGGNSYWGTGNEGTTMSPVSQRSVTKPEDVIVIKGRAIRMESDKISFLLSPVKFAAGNLFTGSYKTNMTDPAASVTFGRPFAGRPDQLTGYYYYRPAGYSGGVNGMDLCHIYIILENRSGSTTRVAYGELLDYRTMDGYEPFTIDINYTSSLPVTHVTLSVTSSRDGGNFNGGVGSVLYVDEFKILYNGQ